MTSYYCTEYNRKTDCALTSISDSLPVLIPVYPATSRFLHSTTTWSQKNLILSSPNIAISNTKRERDEVCFIHKYNVCGSKKCSRTLWAAAPKTNVRLGTRCSLRVESWERSKTFTWFPRVYRHWGSGFDSFQGFISRIYSKRSLPALKTSLRAFVQLE